MNDEAKIQLSTFEMELVNNKEWIFTKQLIIGKVSLLFGRLNEHFKKIISEEKEFLPSQFQKTGGKINKGENYKGLPYIILDYPAIFSKENIFAVRTMFWWGNFFSISLHVSGTHFKERAQISEIMKFLKSKNFSVCVNESEWEHHFEPSNFKNVNELTSSDIENVSKKSFFKIAKKIELSEWNSAEIFLEKIFREIIQLIKVSFPNGETIPSPGLPKAGSGL